MAVSVFNANSGFDVASTLLLYTGPAGSVTTGSLLTDTLTAGPTPTIEESLNTAADGTVSGPVNVSSARAWTISGYINTAHGRVDTTIQASNSFGNMQDEKVSSTIFKQNLTQGTEQHELTTTISSAGTVQTQHDISYPLIVDYNQAPDATGNIAITTSVKQQKIDALRSPIGANSPNPVVSQEAIETTDTLHYTPSFSFINHDTNTATASYGAKDAQHNCVARTLAANALLLTEAQDSTSCSLAP